MPAPSFIQEVETAWDTSTSPKTTASFNVQAGDILVALAVKEHWDSTADNNTTLGISGGSLDWIIAQEVQVADYTHVFLWTATATSTTSMTVSITRSGGIANQVFGANVLTFRSSDGVGASNKTNVSSGAPTLNLTTTQANSAIVVVNGDWTASQAARTWRTNAGALSEVSYFSNGNNYGIYGGYHADAGAINTYAVGLSAPSGQKYSIAAVEIKGTAGAGGVVGPLIDGHLIDHGILQGRLLR